MQQLSELLPALQLYILPRQQGRRGCLGGDGCNAGRDREGHCAGGRLGGRGARCGCGRAVRDDDRAQGDNRAIGMLQYDHVRAAGQHRAVPAIWQNQYSVFQSRNFTFPFFEEW